MATTPGELRELWCARTTSKLEAPGLATGHSPAVSRWSRWSLGPPSSVSVRRGWQCQLSDFSPIQH